MNSNGFFVKVHSLKIFSYLLKRVFLKLVTYRSEWEEIRENKKKDVIGERSTREHGKSSKLQHLFFSLAFSNAYKLFSIPHQKDQQPTTLSGGPRGLKCSEGNNLFLDIFKNVYTNLVTPHNIMATHVTDIHNILFLNFLKLN